MTLLTPAIDRMLAEPPPAPSPGGQRLARAGWLIVAALCLAHGAAIFAGLGGRAGLANPWPLARHDHPLMFHSAVSTRSFLRISGTTAGYDPSFMAGNPKSVIFPASSNLTDLLLSLGDKSQAPRAYKLVVLISSALAPWLVGLAALLWRARPGAAALAVGMDLIYVWTDFPLNYVEFGMMPYFLAVPLGLATAAAFGRFAEQGGRGWWLLAAVGSVLAVLIHFTSAMIVAPSALAAYIVAIRRATRQCELFPAGRHAGVWLIPALVVAANAFWWVPGIWLASTKGDSSFAFSHSAEVVWQRLWQIATTEAPVEAVLWALGLSGLVVLAQRDRVAAAALGGFVAAGFAWGYLAGATPWLDFLQPGRHTYAVYSGLAIASGLAVASLVDRLRAESPWVAAATVLGLALVGVRLFGPPMVASARMRLAGPAPFLSSEPSPQLSWVLDRVRQHVKPGERLLYEEGGFAVPGLRDPFRGGRFSGLLPYYTGVEVLGGPYLHAALTTNFTQFGEGKLFGKSDWDRDWFVRYARLYRPAAIVCWSPRARAFCRSNRDLVQVLDTLELPGEGSILIGRVIGFEGDTIRGRASVKAEPGRLHVSGASADLDGLVVLRYHHVPYLRSRPPARLEPVLQEQDPVPFIGLRPGTGPPEASNPQSWTLEMDFPPVE